MPIGRVYVVATVARVANAPPMKATVVGPLVLLTDRPAVPCGPAGPAGPGGPCGPGFLILSLPFFVQVRQFQGAVLDLLGLDGVLVQIGLVMVLSWMSAEVLRRRPAIGWDPLRTALDIGQDVARVDGRRRGCRVGLAGTSGPAGRDVGDIRVVPVPPGKRIGP